MHEYFIEDHQKPFSMELEAKDLRVGNLVEMADTIQKLLGITEDFVSINEVKDAGSDHWRKVNVPISDVKPILITPELLEKIRLSDGTPVLLWKDDLGLNILADNYPLKQPKYLHELQNLFFDLTGQELAIDL